jgi:nuclear transport factor 2 (NTF2) superfamily protein
MSQPEIRPPVPPFTEETARQKVQAAEDAWNTCDPERVALAYTVDSTWRNRVTGVCWIRLSEMGKPGLLRTSCG